VTGETDSTDFPTASPLQAANAGDSDVFMAKLNAAGSALSYSTYLGGSDDEYGRGIAVDGAGNAYVTGNTQSTDFPTASPLQAANAGKDDAFVAKLDAAGSALAYATYLGGSDFDYGYGIAVDGAGNAHVTGTTQSTDFPTASPLQAYPEGADAFVARLDTAGSALSFSTYLGGDAVEEGYGIAVDGAGNAYVTGYTWSTNFPTASPLQAANAGNDDAFVAKLDASVCGDGVVEGLEECDDGNTAGGDCCSSICQYQPAGSSPCILEARMCGDPVAGCVMPMLVAVVADPEGDARDVQGEVTLNGATAGKLKMRPAAGAPGACGSHAFPPGQVFAGQVKLKAKGGGVLEMQLAATDKAKNSSPSYALPPDILQPNAAPEVGEVTLSQDTFRVGEKGALRVTAEADDDCGIRRASVQMAPRNGAFRSVGSLSDRGSKGDASAGDGIWSGVVKMQCREAGLYDLRVAVEDAQREVGYSETFEVTCQ
jgi:cysteine-rich repeat protein